MIDQEPLLQALLVDYVTQYSTARLLLTGRRSKSGRSHFWKTYNYCAFAYVFFRLRLKKVQRTYPVMKYERFRRSAFRLPVVMYTLLRNEP